MGKLTNEDIALIKKMWSVPSNNLYDVGDIMLYKFFEHYPNYKTMFPKFRDIPLDQLKVILDITLFYLTNKRCLLTFLGPTSL